MILMSKGSRPNLVCVRCATFYKLPRDFQCSKSHDPSWQHRDRFPLHMFLASWKGGSGVKTAKGRGKGL